MATNNETLGYLRVVRGGADVLPENAHGVFAICEGELVVLTDCYEEPDTGVWHAREVCGDYVEMDWDTAITPVRLEPCGPPTWRTDVENAPVNVPVVVIRSNGRIIDAKYNGTQWVTLSGRYTVISVTHWMPLLPMEEE